MEKVYFSTDLSGIANLGWLNANYSFSFTNYTVPRALKYFDSMCHNTIVRFASFGSISSFICILENLMMKYQLHIFKSKKIQDLGETETLSFKFPKSSRILLIEIPMN
jgi:hypothetical protein